MASPERTLLCVCNYASNTGYAWDFIEGLYAGVAARLAPLGVRTLVAYPRIDAPPRSLAGSPAEAVELDATLQTTDSVRATLAFVQREAVRAMYFTDRSVRSPVYIRLRRAGVHRVIVHDHSSGERSPVRGPRAMVKWLLARIPGILADDIIAVSDYVARRHLVTGLIPAARVVRVGTAWRCRRQSMPRRSRCTAVSVSTSTGRSSPVHAEPLLKKACRSCWMRSTSS